MWDRQEGYRVGGEKKKGMYERLKAAKDGAQHKKRAHVGRRKHRSKGEKRKGCDEKKTQSCACCLFHLSMTVFTLIIKTHVTAFYTHIHLVHVGKHTH